MKICIFSPNFKTGGAQKNSINLANYYKKLNYDITILTLNNSGDLYNQLNNDVKRYNLSTHKISFSIFKINKYLNKEKFDVIISMIQETNIILGISSIFSSYKSIILGREANTLNKVKNLNFFVRIIYKFILKFAYSQLHVIISNSNDTRNDLYEMNIKSKRNMNRIIYNPVIDKENYKHQKSNLFKHKWENVEYKKILIVGRLVEQKNHKFCLKVFKNLYLENKNLRLIVLGDGQLKNMLINYSSKLNISEAVDFIGFKENVFDYMKMCDVLVVTSLYEGFGNILVEALFNHMHIVSINCKGGPKEILDYGKFGTLINDYSINHFKEAILKKLYTKKRNINNRYNQFTTEKISQDYLKLINSL